LLNHQFEILPQQNKHEYEVTLLTLHRNFK